MSGRPVPITAQEKSPASIRSKHTSHKPATAVSPLPTILQTITAGQVRAHPAEVLALQPLLGNRVVGHLIQAKLVVGAPGDRYEQEADRTADRVMAMSNPDAGQSVQRQAQSEALQSKPLVQRAAEEEEEVQTKPLVQRQAEEEEELQTKSLVQRRAEGGFEVGGALEERLTALRGDGSSLPGDVRAYMEPRFGADFSNVRVHTDGESGNLNRQLGAQAFTHGQDVYFGAGRFQPASDMGKRLLAHELTHVIQQSGSGPRIARWGANDNGTSHEEVTRQSFEGVEGFSPGARDYLEEMSEQMDMRGSFWGGFVAGRLLQWFSKISKNGNAYDNLIGYWRPPAERLNHAEAGAYMSDGAAADEKHVNDFVNRAVNAWDVDRPHQALTMLALGLHTAEDRGAHGDGRPGEGHDPRRIIKPPPDAKKTTYYKEGWKGTDCDKRSENGEGFDRCLPYARNMLTSFRDQVEAKELDKMKEPSGWSKAWRKFKTWWGAGYSSKERKGGKETKKPPFGGVQVMPPVDQIKEQWRKRGLIRTEQD